MEYQISKSGESWAENLLSHIRPEWKAKNLIQRVNILINSDLSSACQRIFNAAIHDLKQKICVAGLDVAERAAQENRLSTIKKYEDIDQLDTKRVIDLSYYIGLISRPDWRRLNRAYEIRRDLEHEDDEYEASLSDCIAMFEVSIEVVLSKDPVQIIKLTEIKAIVSEPNRAILTEQTIDDYRFAPEVRQLEIYKFLIGFALDQKNADIIRENSYNALGVLKVHTKNSVIIECAKELQDKIGIKVPTELVMKVAAQGGLLIYLKKAQIRGYFNNYYERLSKIDTSFKAHESHNDILNELERLDGINYCPDECIYPILKWMALCYLGEPSYGQHSLTRDVFYSNVGAYSIERILKGCKKKLVLFFDKLKEDLDVNTKITTKHIRRRFDELLDMQSNIIEGI